MCEWLDFDYFSGIPTLGSSHVNFVFFLKKKKIFFFCSWTSTQITLKFFQHVSAMLNFKFFLFGPAMCWHATLTLTLINPHLEWMWCEFEFYLTLNMLGWTLVILIKIYFILFGYTPIVI